VNEKYAKNSSETIWTKNHSCDYNKLRLFLEHGAQVNAKDSSGNTVLHKLVKLSNVESVKFLVEKGADVNARNNDGQTPLFFAAKTACPSDVSFLIEKGCDVNLVDKSGNTALHIASDANSRETVDLLMRSGADPTIKNAEGKSANEAAQTSTDSGLTSTRIASAIRPVRSSSLLSLSSEGGHVQKLKELIISRLKEGAKQLNYDRDGSSVLAFENGVYVYKHTNKSQSVNHEQVYGTDEQVINFMFNKYRSVNQNRPVNTYEFILSNLF
jgi:ankyrin repeat protein